METTFARISMDPRHRAIIRLQSGTIDRRQFPGWAMATKMAAKGQSLQETVEPLVRNCEREIAAELLKFAEARDRAASTQAARQDQRG